MIDEMANNLFQGTKIAAAEDLIFSPILTHDVDKRIVLLQAQDAIGLYQVCGSEIWSRYQLACKLTDASQISHDLLDKISHDNLGKSFQRPKNPSMSNKIFFQLNGIKTHSMLACIQQLAVRYSLMESM